MNLLYCAIKSEQIVYETIYSIFSLHKIYLNDFNSININIITDFPSEMFDPINRFSNVHIEKIDNKVVESWCLTGGAYIFKVKIHALMYYFSRNDSDVLFVDSDTIYTDKIDYIFKEINNGKFVMNFKCMSINRVIDKYKNVDLSLINDEEARKRIFIYRDMYRVGHIKSQNKTKCYEIPELFTPYNSGVIGIKHSDRRLLNDVLDVCESIYSKYNYICSEEFAFSLVFCLTNREILECNESIYHYFPEKRTRFIIAYVINTIHLNDINLLETKISELKVDRRHLCVLELKDIPYFIAELLSKNNSQHEQTYLTNFNNYKLKISEIRRLKKKLFAIDRM